MTRGGKVVSKILNLFFFEEIMRALKMILETLVGKIHPKDRYLYERAMFGLSKKKIFFEVGQLHLATDGPQVKFSKTSKFCIKSKGQNSH